MRRADPALQGIVLPVVLTLAIQILASLAVFTPPVLAPEAAPEMGVAAAGVGIVTSLIYLSAAAAALTSGGFIVRFGPMRVSQGSLILVAAGIALIAVGHVAAAVLGAILIGLGYGPVTPSSSAVLNERTPDRWRAMIFSVKQTGVPIGGAIAGAMVPAMMALAGWRTAALVVTVGSVVLAVLVQPWRAAADAGRDRSRRLLDVRLREPLRIMWTRRPLRELAFASFAYSGMQMCLGSYLVVHLVESAGRGVVFAGAAMSAAMAGGVIGRIFWGVVADRAVPPRRLLGALGVGMTLASFVIGFVDHDWPAVAIFALAFVFGATAVGWNGVYISEVGRIVPRDQAAAVTGAVFSMTYLGVFISPLAIWLVVSLGFGYGAGFALVGLLTLWRASFFFRRA